MAPLTIRSWDFKCADIQVHKKADCLASSPDKECPFCLLIAQHQSGPCEESIARWPTYLTKSRKIDLQEMLRKIDIPAMIASIDFNQKPGFAFFKEGIKPEWSKLHGGRYILQLFGRKDDDELAKKFKEVMRISIEKIYKSRALRLLINGTFIRGEVNSVMSMAKDANNYADPAKLPYMIRLEIWLPKNFEVLDKLYEAMDGIKEEMIEMGLVEGIGFMGFRRESKISKSPKLQM